MGDLSKRLREVSGLHAFAELFGFSWADESDWTWHDVARAMADAIDAETGNRSCASCPEMDNPDSYISHIHAALEWHDEHVPRPTNPINTCVVLEGEKIPEEVLFIREGGGVTHYLPEGTCKGEIDSDYFECKLVTFKCKTCGWSGVIDSGYVGYSFGGTDMPRHCPNCGKRIIEEVYR